MIKPDSTDAMTQELLQLLFHTFSVTTQRLLIDHLPNGAYYNVSDRSIIEETASVPTTNVSPEGFCRSRLVFKGEAKCTTYCFRSHDLVYS